MASEMVYSWKSFSWETSERDKNVNSPWLWTELREHLLLIFDSCVTCICSHEIVTELKETIRKKHIVNSPCSAMRASVTSLPLNLSWVAHSSQDGCENGSRGGKTYRKRIARDDGVLGRHTERQGSRRNMEEKEENHLRRSQEATQCSSPRISQVAPLKSSWIIGSYLQVL